MSDPIRLRGVREHNLQSVDVELPRDRLTVLVGVSGSGKSSLLFDTLFVEGQRRYLEALAASARNLSVGFARPAVDMVEGLPPTVAVAAGRRRAAARATVGSLSEVHDLLAVLWARLGTPHCPSCDQPLVQLTPQEMLDRILVLDTGTRVQLGAPLGGEGLPLAERLAQARADGFVRMRAGGEILDIDDVEELAPASPLQVIVDRLVVRERDLLRPRLADSLEVALRAGRGVAFALLGGGAGEPPEERWFSERLRCPACACELEPLSTALFSHSSPRGACRACAGLGGSDAGVPCDACGGSRLCDLARRVRFAGCVFPEVLALRPAELRAWLEALAPSTAHRPIALPVVKQVLARTRLLDRVGLGYLTFDRAADSLATGELSRALLATHCGTSLAGVLYCLDEPSAGLHPQDTARLVEVLLGLRDGGSTVVVCEHDLGVLAAADHLIEFGPGAGRLGGRIVYAGDLAGLRRADTATGRALRGELRPVRAAIAGAAPGTLSLRGARGRNLRVVDVLIPLGRLVGVCGPSGSGKSSLIRDTLEPALNGHPGLPYDKLEGAAWVSRTVRIDPAALPRGDRSVPATALGILAPLRALFAATREARVRGWGAERFSFNTPGGRCQACGGRGTRKIELELLPDVTLPCEVCRGSRYDRETLEVRFRGLSIADVLALTADEARELFARIPKVEPLLSTLCEVGLGYLRLGQPAATLSGGERQRLRLASELGKPRALAGTLFLLDEPTIGLHPADVAVLVGVFDRLLAAGATVLCIEHNLELLRAADHLIELGPGGGPDGGRLVAQGTPAEVCATEGSPTGRFLASGS